LSKISVDKANAEYIAKTGVINGTLLVQLTELLSALADTGGEDKVINKDCAINKSEFNCGYSNPCVICPNYIPYVQS
jgi:hypothetical protein